MTKLKTPNEIYFKHGVIKFNQQNKELYYDVWVWRKDGLNKSRYSNKHKLHEGELEVLRTFTDQEEVFRHLNTSN